MPPSQPRRRPARAPTGDGSAKFGEIGRAGASVTVRFGRIGTEGRTEERTKVEDLASEAAAIAHVTELIAEKERKDYAEPATASPTTTQATQAGTAPVPAGRRRVPRPADRRTGTDPRGTAEIRTVQAEGNARRATLTSPGRRRPAAVPAPPAGQTTSVRTPVERRGRTVKDW
ncbi:WGR domain-containing protein [Actinosynnema sp. NPDC023587]|uniref:WGR domain-containing protein n=1 Tax=Actinosynnema sp. NPDC023587 TaxID=3154695 RepID=UPI0033C5EA89